MHPELVELTNARNDTRVVFLQLPILSKTSVKLAKLVLAAKYQGKGFEIHHALLTQQGSLTDEKINKIINDVKLDSKLSNQKKFIYKNWKYRSKVSSKENITRKMHRHKYSRYTH